MSLTIHIHPVSQPSRALLWALTLKKTPHTVAFVDILAGEFLKPEFLAKFPLGYVPGLEVREGDAEPFYVSEFGAIVEYVAETQAPGAWADLVPADVKARARVREWIQWHYGGIRRCTTGFVRPVLGALKSQDVQAVVAGAAFIKGELEGHVADMEANARWATRPAGDAGFLVAGTAAPTAADLLLYCEVDQLETMGVLDGVLARHPHFARWVAAMKAVPHHDEVRKVMYDMLGPLKPVLAQMIPQDKL